MYRPITATPFARDAAYTEIAPCDALRPYICCFWGTPEPVCTAGIVSEEKRLVIPDTCMDIIFRIDYTHNLVHNSFCAIDEKYYSAGSTGNPALTSTFSIRFYAWAAVLFAENSFAGSKNHAFAVDEFFPALEKELMPMLFSVSSLSMRAEIAGRYLLGRLKPHHRNNNLMNAISDIIRARGASRISDLSDRNAISGKQLERIFNENMGISPKSFSSLVRYQMLWQELCFGGYFDVHELVEKYGYSDQAHLLNDFKKHHSMTPAQAIRLARG